MFDNLIMKAPRSLMFSKRIFHFSNLNILLKMLNTIICYFLKEELGEEGKRSTIVHDWAIFYFFCVLVN